jgi:hypothetical protein
MLVPVFDALVQRLTAFAENKVIVLQGVLFMCDKRYNYPYGIQQKRIR